MKTTAKLTSEVSEKIGQLSMTSQQFIASAAAEKEAALGKRSEFERFLAAVPA